MSIKNDYKYYFKKKKKKRKTPLIVKLQKDAKGLSYKKFLQSKYWHEVRKMVFRRDDYKCIICKSDKDLQVHHQTYKHHFLEHKYLHELDTLCKKCHQEYHETINDMK